MAHEDKAHKGPDTSAVSLSDVLQHVPALLQLLSLSAKAALFKSSKSLRRQLRGSFTLLQPASPLEARLLLRRSWQCLQTIDITGIPLPTDSVKQLSMQSMPYLKKLQLSCPGLSDSAVAQLASGQWPQLHTLIIHSARLGLATIAALSSASWPLLQELRLYSIQVTPDTGTFQSAFPLLQTLALNFTGSAESAAVLHRVLELVTASSWLLLDALDISYSNFDAVAAAYLMAAGDWPALRSLKLVLAFTESAPLQLMTDRWPKLEHLDVTFVWGAGSVMQHTDHISWPQLEVLHLQPYTMAVLSGSQFSWPLLHTLDLNSNCLSRADMEMVVTGNWPMLQSLDLSLCDLDADSVQPLIHAKWPLLQKLFLDDNALDLQAIRYLTAARFPKLEVLELGMNNLDFYAIAELTHGDWRELRVLGLCKSCPPQAVAYLVIGNWVKLEMLVLSYNRLDTKAAVSLSRSAWPMLQVLRLSHCSLDSAAVAHLVRGKWPQLSVLHLCHNGIDLASVRELLKANWPVLTELNLAGNVMHAAAVDELCKGKWPLLNKLDLSGISTRGRARAEVIFGSLCQQSGVLCLPPLDSPCWLYWSSLLYAGCWPFLRNLIV